MPEDDITSLRYWVANQALDGDRIKGKHTFKCSDNTLWESIPYKEDRLQRITKKPVERHQGPFATLARFLTSI